LLDRGQSEPCAAETRGDRDVGLRERPEQALDLGKRQADAAVGNRKANSDLALEAAHRRDLQRNGALFSELHRIIDQIFQRRAQPDRIADRKRGKFFRKLDGSLQALRRGPSHQRIAGVARERAQIEKILPDREAGTIASRRVDEQGGEARQMFGAGLDGVDPAPLPLVEVGCGEQIADRENAGQRRAHLVSKRRQRRLHHAGARLGPGTRARAARLCRDL